MYVCMYNIDALHSFGCMYVCSREPCMYLLPDGMVHTYGPDRNPGLISISLDFGTQTATVPHARNSSVGARMPRDVRLGPRSRLPKHMVPGKYPRALLQ